jgi:hypothetical protein
MGAIADYYVKDCIYNLEKASRWRFKSSIALTGGVGYQSIAGIILSESTKI